MPFEHDVIHLEILGQQRQLDIDRPAGTCTATDLLPAARALSSLLSDAVIQDAEARGKKVSCGPGCGTCCRQMVGISAIEAIGVAQTVAAMPEPRQNRIRHRFEDAVTRLETAGLLDPNQTPGQRTLRGLGHDDDKTTAKQTSRDYFALGIPCPFLEDESCSIYPERPMMCREYTVTSPVASCANPDLTGVEKLTPPAHVGAALGRTAGELLNAEPRVLPLTLSLEWSTAHASQAEQPIDGERAYESWIGHLGGTVED